VSAAVYDWWSRHPRALTSLYAVAFLGREATFRRRSLDALDPAPGERLLELGCGPANSFPALRAGVGDAGTVVGVDASHGMTEAARSRAGEWANVHVVRGDAVRPPIDAGTVDGAYAAMSLSAMPDPAGAVEAAWRCLRPGGRLVVLDAQPFRRLPWRLVNPVIEPLAARLTDWVPGVDLPAALRKTFATVDVSTFHGGSILLARAEKHPE
jgi:phosphatidylethanolamine/phosphatidyl-N-methylethanolamine N-methyltransferase